VDPTAPVAITDITDPLQWLKRLDTKLSKRQGEIETYESYYDGRQKLAFATEQFKKAFGDKFKAFADNWMEIVVDAVAERLDVQGFRIPGDTKPDASTDPEAATEELTTGDSEAWDIWQANDLDAGSHELHASALVDKIAYVSVGPARDGGEYPIITPESAQQVIVECAPDYRRRRLAGLKKWHDDVTGLTYATVYLPTEIYKYQSKKKTTGVVSSAIEWVQREGLPADETWPMANTLGVVPFVPFPNRPSLLSEGRSEIGQLIPLQDAINKLFMDMLVASEFSGFVQRWATGIEDVVDPETHQKIDVMKMALDHFLMASDPDAKFGTLPASELGNYTGAIAMAVQHLASRSSTPPHYFLAHSGNFPSGESLKAAETGLVSKVKRRQRHFGEAWEEVIRLAFVAQGKSDKANAARAAETIWADPESRSESEHIDAIIKLSTLGVPAEILIEKSGMFSTQDMARIRELLAKGAPVVKPPAPPALPAPTQ
jgi:hypothetical protein